MFKIDCFVKDKDLGELMKRLAGVALNVNQVYVPNVEAAPNGKKVYQTSKDTVDMLSKELHRRGKTEIMGAEIKDVLVKLSFNPSSYSHYVANLLRAGVLKKGKKIGTATQYIVTGR